MSPLVVSKILPAQRLFDLVVFDEASQVRPHDAVTSIMRGGQVVVAGDPKQLPPNNLFAWLEAESQDDDPTVQADLADYESILDVLEPVLPVHLLRWHYRSRDDRLIAFSNQHFYGSDLVTFAGCRQESPVRLDVVNGTASPGSNGIAQVEVERVVELVRQHALVHPQESLGVIAFGSKQSDAIEQRLRSAEDANLANFIARHDVSGRRLFVKNLERVQGDERDAVILSVGKAKSAAGVVTLNFGALGNEGGERRLNVAVTRAKSRLTVVSSFRPAELRPNATKNPGPELLRQFLEFADAQGARTPSTVGRRLDTIPLNGFERSILQALTSRGIDVHPQWGIGNYSIDFALAHPSEPGRMVLALEADGDRYHRVPAARDRDRLRQEHLERLGWRFYRVWSSDWFRSPEIQAARIENAWRRAVEDADRLASLSEPAPVSIALDDVPAVHRGPCPIRVPRDSIDDYTHQELITFFAWLLTDDLLLPEEDRLREALTPLGFQKLGNKIRSRMTSALAVAQRRVTEGSTDARIG
jgi:very-short-patch-repair endonuclease